MEIRFQCKPHREVQNHIRKWYHINPQGHPLSQTLPLGLESSQRAVTLHVPAVWWEGRHSEKELVDLILCLDPCVKNHDSHQLLDMACIPGALLASRRAVRFTHAMIQS